LIALLLLLDRKVYSPILQDPAATLRKFNDGALRVEKEEVFSVRDR
jgi:hypothetical protein